MKDSSLGFLFVTFRGSDITFITSIDVVQRLHTLFQLIQRSMQGNKNLLVFRYSFPVADASCCKHLIQEAKPPNLLLTSSPHSVRWRSLDFLWQGPLICTRSSFLEEIVEFHKNTTQIYIDQQAFSELWSRCPWPHIVGTVSYCTVFSTCFFHILHKKSSGKLSNSNIHAIVCFR